ncbi:MAG: cytochrome c [Gammaproteobacteria bacterium]|nr:MAG: cytochrome c [Gammaproteobacteria bacterium]
MSERALKAWPLAGALLAGALAWAAPAAAGTPSGRDLYKTYCWQCHGSRGNGKGINAGDNMSVMPRDHTDAKYMAARSDEELFRAIKEGGPAVNKSVLMPPWGGALSDEEIHRLVAYLRELCRCRHGAAP